MLYGSGCTDRTSQVSYLAVCFQCIKILNTNNPYGCGARKSSKCCDVVCNKNNLGKVHLRMRISLYRYLIFYFYFVVIGLFRIFRIRYFTSHVLLIFWIRILFYFLFNILNLGFCFMIFVCVAQVMVFKFPSFCR